MINEKNIFASETCIIECVSSANIPIPIKHTEDNIPMIDPDMLIDLINLDLENRVEITIQKGIKLAPTTTHAIKNNVLEMILGEPVFMLMVVPK